MKSAATTIHIKVTVKTRDEKYYLVFGAGDEGVAAGLVILPIIAYVVYVAQPQSRQTWKILNNANGHH